MNKNFTIRAVKEKDVDGILEIYAPFITGSVVSFEEEVPGPELMWNRISSITADLPFLICEHQKKVTGYAYASTHRVRQAYRWSKEVSVYVHPEYRKKGIASALYTALFEMLKYQGVVNLLAGITIPNPESVRFHEKMGFRKTGEFARIGFKFDAWHNVGWWELRLFPEETKPGEIIPFPEIKHSRAAKSAVKKGEEQIKL